MGTHLLCKQACLLRPLPPNFTMFWQALHFPHSGCWQTWSRDRGQAEHGQTQRRWGAQAGGTGNSVASGNRSPAPRE